MSDARDDTVLGLITSVIAIIEASQDLYNAALNAQGLHEAFRVVSQTVPLILSVLHDYEKAQEQIHQEYTRTKDAGRRSDIKDFSKGVKPLLVACEKNAKRLKEIFEAVVQGDVASWAERYEKSIRDYPPEERKVEDLMRDIVQKLLFLQARLGFIIEDRQQSEKNKENAKVLGSAIPRLSKLAASLPEEARDRYHWSGAAACREYISGVNNVQGGSSSNYSNYNEDFSFGTSKFDA